jgi:hypothetical protein
LRRWWFAIPEWPHKDFDYLKKLEEKKLRRVDKVTWKFSPNTDNEYKKCVEMDGFRGVFVDYLGKVHDCRPEEGKPSYNNFMKMVNFLYLITY